MSPQRLRFAGLACLAVPAALLLLFAVAELVGGDLSGVQHLPEVALVAAIGWAAWHWPYRAGMVLMLASAALALVLWLHPARITLLGIAIMELLLFIPAIAAGACFTLAGAVERGDLGGRDGGAGEAGGGAQPSR